MTINKKSNKSIVSYGISATITLSLATILYDDLFDFILYSQNNGKLNVFCSKLIGDTHGLAKQQGRKT